VSRYKVLVDDNFDYMDQDKRYEHGVFLTAEEGNFGVQTHCRFESE
jgi:hypothetical protein